MARSPVFDDVDPRLVNLLNQVGGAYSPYGMRLISGYRAPGGQGGQGYHPKGRAADVELFDRKTGAALKNYQDPAQFAAYQQFANQVYGAADPELQKQLRWGGYFSGGKGKYGALDLMHFDTGGAETPMAGGSWAAGLTPEQAQIWGLQAGGGVDGASGQQQGPPANTPVQSYLPEQRRNAIASIESAGSGDYAALGPVTNRQGDRAYGRYQIMGSNIPAWSKAVLGREVTVDEFMADPKIQDAIFDAQFGDYVQKYGEQGAAEAWFGGPGNVGKKGAEDILGTNVGGYGSKYMKALGAAGGTGTAVAGTSPGTGPDIAKPQKPTDAPTGAKEGFDLGKTVADIGSDLAGSSGGYKGIPNVPMAKPTATLTQPQEALTLNPQMAQASRDRLAMAMARLNSGKLWVG